MEVGEISDNGQILIPMQLREKYNLNIGDTIFLMERENDLLLVPRIRLLKFTDIHLEKGLLEDLIDLRKEERAI